MARFRITRTEEVPGDTPEAQIAWVQRGIASMERTLAGMEQDLLRKVEAIATLRGQIRESRALENHIREQAEKVRRL